MAAEEHFPGCHPEHDQGDQPMPEGLKPGDADKCWHCETLTPQGCDCADCWEGADDIPPSAIFHCRTCKRWWAYMIPRITKITFGAAADG